HNHRLLADDGAIGAPNAPRSHHRLERWISLCDWGILCTPIAHKHSFTVRCAFGCSTEPARPSQRAPPRRWRPDPRRVRGADSAAKRADSAAKRADSAAKRADSAAKRADSAAKRADPRRTATAPADLRPAQTAG